MTDAAVAGCESEPIRVPGAVQPHGVLLAVSEPQLSVVVASANAEELFGCAVAGVRLEQLLERSDYARLVAGLAGEVAELNPLRIQVSGVAVDLVVHRRDGLLVAEFEPLAGGAQAGATWHAKLPLVLQRLSATDNIGHLSEVLARDVRALTGFDRVMVYRFARDWNGEVIAEARDEALESLLGHHFPASDIPAQARDLYATQWLRLIPDARYAPVPLTPAGNPLTAGPLDLSGAFLRSVSPVHLEYLANMGVRASMSVSLIDRGKLWGLVACHHYSGPRRPSYIDRVAAEFLGRTASLLLASKEDFDDQHRMVNVANQQAALAGALGRTPHLPLAALTDAQGGMLALLPSSGAAIRLGGRLTILGKTPSTARSAAVVASLLAAGVVSTDSLGRELPDAADIASTASGVLAVPVGSQPGDFLAWFRSEVPREITWGGDPNATKIVDEERGTRLSPRRSFASWTQTVTGTAPPWAVHEVKAAQQLAAHVAEVVLRRAVDDSRMAGALQRTLLMQELPRIPGVALAARYKPSAQDVVGGDWYDLILLPSGKVSIVLGDVAGHGLSAAATTAQLRHGLRAQLLRDSGPAAALCALNELIAVLLAGELATAIVAELDPATGVVTIANAGHPPVLALTGGGSFTFVEEGRGPALGLLPGARYGEATLVLSGDDRLVVYSDGLVERRHDDVSDELQRVGSAAQAAGRDPDALLDAILAALRPPEDDDVTLLAIGLG